MISEFFYWHANKRMSGIKNNTGNFRFNRGGGCGSCCGLTGTTGANLGATILVRSAPVAYSDLASGGTKIIYTATSGTAQYSILNAYIVAQGSTTWDLAGDRSIIITDGTNTFGTIGSTTLQNTATTSYGFIASVNNVYGIYYPSTDPLVTSTSGSNIYCVYQGGTTDYISGTGLISLVLYQTHL